MPRKSAPAAQAPSTFPSLLEEDAQPLPMLADDSKVTVALKELGVDLSHVKGKPKAGDRAEILAGFYWTSVHDTDFESHISRAPESMWRLLAKALGLDLTNYQSSRSGHPSCFAEHSSGPTPLILRRSTNRLSVALARSRSRASESRSRTIMQRQTMAEKARGREGAE